ncbi:MAG TPA: hypothetical protein DD390_12095 [Rhodospirillaceae bacterium]|nr:hypothetical protein [Rhodospirillaceae bacterium]
MVCKTVGLVKKTVADARSLFSGCRLAVVLAAMAISLAATGSSSYAQSQSGRPDLSSPLAGEASGAQAVVSTPQIGSQVEPGTGQTSTSQPGAQTGSQPGSQTGTGLTQEAPTSVQVQVLEEAGTTSLMSSGNQANSAPSIRARVVSAAGGPETGAGSGAPGAAEDSRLKGVTVEGAMQTEETKDARLLAKGVRYQSRIVWDSVTVEMPNGDIRRLYLDEALESDVALRTRPVIPSGTTMTAQGNINGLLKIAQDLQNGETQENNTNDETDNAPSNGVGAGAEALTGGTADSGSKDDGNQVASPEIPVKEEEDKLPVITTTTEGCPVDIDIENGVVKRTSKTIVDGVAEACSPDGTTFAIKQSTVSCPIQEDIAALKAYPTYTSYYTDGNGSRQTISDGCERGDESDFYAIVERPDRCTIEENKAEFAVYNRVELGYSTPQGQFAVVRGCERETDTPVATMEYTEEGCGTSTHAVTGAITQLQRLHYVLNGSDETVAACAATTDSVVWIYQTTGCPVSIDTSANQVRVMHRLFEDETPIGECQPSGVTFPLQRDSLGCNVEVDLPSLKAFPRFNTFYVGNDQVKTPVGDGCARGTEEDYYTIYKDSDVCDPFVDLIAREVFEQTETRYRKPQGDVVTVLSCAVQADAVKVADITVSTTGCTLADDFENNISQQRTKLVYLLKGIERIASICQVRDDSPSYAQATIVCGEEIDRVGGTQALRTKVQIEVDRLPVDRTACLVDEATVVGMSKVTETCRSNFSHDVPGAVSYGYSRYRYERDGVITFATGCEVDPEITFTHNISDPVSWVLNDPDKSALARREISFQAYDQYVLVQAASVLEEETPAPYEFSGVSVINGSPSYDGCTKTTPRLESDAYTRPDTTVLYELTGNQDPAVVAYACTVVQIPTWQKIAERVGSYTVPVQCYASYGEGGGYYYNGQAGYSYRDADYQGSRILSRDDGVQIDQTSSANRTVRTTGYGGSTCDPGWPGSVPTPPAQPATYNGAQIPTWNQAEGW